jgi:hypothetical protein
LEDTGSWPSLPNRLHEIRLFSKSRNERLRLPAFLRHYRGLGVHRFFIADNDSTDGSVEYLREQPDVHIFSTAESFRAARGGTDWLNLLLGTFGVGGWCLTVDVDELFVYPGSDTTSLKKLTQYLDAQGYEAMHAPLLDLYPGGPIGDCRYQPGDDLVSAAPFFDGGPYYQFPHDQCPGYLRYGGVRERMFYPASWAGGWRRRLHVTLYRSIIPSIPVVRRAAWLLSRKPIFPPCLTKVPLIRWDAHTEYLNVNHFSSPKTLAPVSGVLLHFKLLQDFHDRALREAARGEYYDGASEFRRYAETLRSNPNVTFHFQGSERFANEAQLVRLGLMHDTEQWARARAGASSIAADTG